MVSGSRAGFIICETKECVFFSCMNDILTFERHVPSLYVDVERYEHLDLGTPTQSVLLLETVSVIG